MKSLEGDGGGILVELATVDADGETGSDGEGQTGSIAGLIDRVDQLECEATEDCCDECHRLCSRELHAQAMHWNQVMRKWLVDALLL